MPEAYPVRRRHRKRRPTLDRFLEKIEYLDCGCWRWTGHLSRAGYGRLQEGGRDGEVLYAHRFAYEQKHGPIPEGKHLDHLCRNRWCVNPDHLEPVTPRENALRGDAPTVQVHRSGQCSRGHELNEENAYYRKDRPGRRDCRQCRRERRQAAKAQASGGV